MTKRKDIDIVRCCQSLQHIKFENTDSLSCIWDKAFAIFKQFNIRQWAKSIDEHGNEQTTGNTPEWVICKTVFLKNISFNLEMYDMFGEVPEDIQCYELND